MAEQRPVRFSIITVTYNAARHLEETIRSVAAQTYTEIEYIVVDGASRDHTDQIVKNYCDYIHTFISEPDQGIYDAMNKGLRRATGDYLCFLNAGDTFHSTETLQQMVDSLPAGEWPDVIYGETALVDDQRHFLRMRRLSAPEHLTWKSFRQGMLVCHQAFFPRRGLAPQYNTKYRFSADFDWCIRVMKQATLLHHTRLTLIDYLSEGTTTANRKASLIERFRIMRKHYGTLSTIGHHLWFVIRLLTRPGQ
ncbi:MAG: glycosyltransferase [Bacteroides sp.]|nr:glycosyltransferase [Bacteroides sp.]